MVMFNLLPWRSLQLKYQADRVRRVLLGCVFISLLTIFLLHLLFLKLEQLSQKKIAKLQQLSMLKHSETAMNSQLNQEIIIYQKATQALFLDLADNFYSNVCLNEITREGQYIRLEGRARSAADLELFLKNWSGVNLFSQVQIEQLKEQEENGSLNFKLAGLENAAFPYQTTNNEKLNSHAL